MKYLIALKCLLFISLSINGQHGFYKNPFGYYGGSNPPQAPYIIRMNKTHDNGFILSTQTSLQKNYCSYVKLDSNYNHVWTTSYPIPGYLEYAIELDDNSFVGLCDPTSSIGNNIVRHDVNGNLLTSKYYSVGGSFDMNSGAICKSSSNDTGYVAVYAACALRYGLLKFNKNGNVLWAKEYGTNNNNRIGASVYHLIQAHKRGYLTCGQSDNSRLGVLSIIDDNGQMVRAREYSLSPGSNMSYIYTPYRSNDNSYYVWGVMGHFYNLSTPSFLEKDAYILNIDTNLVEKNCWKFSAPSSDQRVYIKSINNTSNNDIIISGMLWDTVISQTKLFVLRFNPSSNGKIVWCKTFAPLSVNWWWAKTQAFPGLQVVGNNDNIVFPIFSDGDGTGIVGIDSSGNGLCNSSNIGITVSRWTQHSSSPISFFGTSVTVGEHTQPLTPIIETHRDTTICSYTPNAIVEYAKNINMFTVYSNENNVNITNLMNASINFEIYNSAGQIVLKKQIPAFASEQFQIETKGIYIIRGIEKSNFQSDKFLIY